MKLHVSMFALLSIVVSLVQPAWSMEDQASGNPHFLKRKRDESQSPQPLKGGDLQEGGKNPLISVKQEDQARGENEEEEEEETSSKKRRKKLTDITELRPYFRDGHLEINRKNYDTVLNFSESYDPEFQSYNQGVFVKGWKASEDFDLLRHLLYSFTHIKSFKLRIKWDKEGDLTDLLCQNIQFYEDIEKLDISNCHITDRNIGDIRESIRFPDKLRVLDVRNNFLSDEAIEKLRAHFKNLTKLRYSQGADAEEVKSGIEEEKRKAALGYQKAADEGNAEALYTLADCYALGMGVQEDLKKAWELRQLWWQRLTDGS